MPLNVRSFLASAAFLLSGFALSDAQTAAPVNSSPATTAQNTPVTTKIAAPTSAEIMRERISKAKAFIAVKNYNAAIYELENIRRETGDQTVHGVINVLLMNSYLEQSDYTRAQAFLKELYNPQKSAKPTASAHYFAAAGQVVKGARNQLERYRSLGLTVSDRSLPLEASVDIEKMRETLELVVEQSKTIGAEKSKTADAMALLEEATASRGSLAKDDYDAKRWKDEIGDAREQLTSSRSVITNAVNEPTTNTPVVSPDSVAANLPVANSNGTNPKPSESAPVFKPVAVETAVSKSNNSEAKPNIDSSVKPDAKNVEKVNETPKQQQPQPRQTNETAKANETSQTKPENSENKTAAEPQTAKTETPNDGSPLKVGSLVGYATNQAKPVYPIAAKTMRMGGIVKVEVLVNESGEVTEVQNTTGPPMLQRAAVDAVKKWKFKPFVKDGQPTKASGFVNFNFAL